jgi:hypothetical protein
MIRNLSNIRHLVTAFEAGALHPHEWNHRTRLVLGLWHILNPSLGGPLAAMRRGIMACEANMRYSRLRQRGYSEAVTASYLERIREFAISAPESLGLLDLTNALLASELSRRESAVRVVRAGARGIQPVGIPSPGSRRRAGRKATGLHAVAAH